MKSYQRSTGCSSGEFENLDDNFKTETIEQIVPADSNGNRVAHGNVIMHTMEQMPGTLRTAPSGADFSMDNLPDKDETS